MLLFAVIWLLCCTAAAAEICEHDFQLRETPASCTENGYRGYKCSLCGLTVDYEVLPKLGHSWGGWTVLSHPSCSDFGLQQKTCLVCGDVVQEPMDKLPHEYEVWIQKPTCGRSGYTLHTCVECGHEEKTDRVEALGHDLQTLVVQPTCTKDGYTVYSCSE